MNHVIIASAGQEAVQQLINALSLGATYALLALGLAMVYSILGLINFAHGELVTVAGYTMCLASRRGLSFPIQIILAIVFASFAGVLMERIAFRPLRGKSFLTLLFASFAVSVIIQNLFIALVSARQQGVLLPAIFSQPLRIGTLSFGWVNVITTATALATFAVLLLFLRRSKYGLGMLAASQDFQVTRLMGIRANRVIAMAFAISGALAGIAAIFIVARRGTVDPTMGFVPILKSFISIVIGGLSLEGAVVGGFVLGAIEVGLEALLPSAAQPFRDAFSLVIVVAILYFRPQGIVSTAQEGA
jgi:branched-chain amino acid transport system permease protein